MQEDEQQKPPKSSLNSVFWRRAGWAMLGLVLSLLVLAMIAPLFIDWNAYRPRMEAALAAATGRDVVIGGDLSVRTVPALALRAGDVRIGNHEGGVAANLVAMDRFDVVIALFPLLKGDLKIRRIELLAPIVALERSADGRENWRLPIFLPPEAGEPSAAASPTGTSGDRDRFSLDDLRIKNGAVRYHDHQSDRTFHLNEIDIALEVQALAGPYRLQMAAQSGDIPLELELKADRFAPDRRTLYRCGSKLMKRGSVFQVGSGKRPSPYPMPIFFHPGARYPIFRSSLMQKPMIWVNFLEISRRWAVLFCPSHGFRPSKICPKPPGWIKLLI
ncbi:hypothetical protein JCM17846_16720 [Iodidimonas nitroreducens]|uniref:AsmA domain-containing protein n=1 Tax=Iodidimonas nitroreducens TaxID=1236968 RepID=A0A5A7N993_9PROT|nr:AsmA family protein [Iodidimonas nitroreducens]GER03990.1 hypothetical protein JCM17846_16720 [Iodidimonas nitroreducens]